MVSRGRQVAPLRVYTGSLDVASCPLPSELLSLPGFIDNGFRMKGKQPCSADSQSWCPASCRTISQSSLSKAF